MRQMVMIFKDSYEDLSPERLAYIIERFDAGRPGDITPGTQIDRINSAPAGGLTSLKTEMKPDIHGAAKASREIAFARGDQGGTAGKANDGDRNGLSGQGQSQCEGPFEDRRHRHRGSGDECCAQEVGHNP